jgi:hypothetical protein
VDVGGIWRRRLVSGRLVSGRFVGRRFVGRRFVGRRFVGGRLVSGRLFTRGHTVITRKLQAIIELVVSQRLMERLLGLVALENDLALVDLDVILSESWFRKTVLVQLLGLTGVTRLGGPIKFGAASHQGSKADNGKAKGDGVVLRFHDFTLASEMSETNVCF